MRSTMSIYLNKSPQNIVKEHISSKWTNFCTRRQYGPFLLHPFLYISMAAKERHFFTSLCKHDNNNENS